MTSQVEAPVELSPKLRASFRRYQVVAYVAGVILVVFCVAIALKYGWHNEGPMSVVARVHGFSYMVYVVLAFDFTRQMGWSMKKTVLVLLAGTVPLMSFVAERRLAREVNALPTRK